MNGCFMDTIALSHPIERNAADAQLLYGDDYLSL